MRGVKFSVAIFRTCYTSSPGFLSWHYNLGRKDFLWSLRPSPQNVFCLSDTESQPKHCSAPALPSRRNQQAWRTRGMERFRERSSHDVSCKRKFWNLFGLEIFVAMHTNASQRWESLPFLQLVSLDNLRQLLDCSVGRVKVKNTEHWQHDTIPIKFGRIYLEHDVKHLSFFGYWTLNQSAKHDFMLCSECFC